MTALELQYAQDYFINKQRLHNRILHGAGVVSGLEVSTPGGSTSPPESVYVGEGVALDGYGREIIVPSPVQLDLNSRFKPAEVGTGRDLFVWIRYDEVVTDRGDGTGRGSIMVVESFRVDAGWAPPSISANDSLVLARIGVMTSGERITVSEIDNSASHGGVMLRRRIRRGD